MYRKLPSSLVSFRVFIPRGSVRFASSRRLDSVSSKRISSSVVSEPQEVRSAEDDIFNAISPDGQAPVYSRVPEFITNRQAERSTSTHRKKKEDAVILCKNSKLNHYRNQRYRDAESVPLASRGWNHYKAKGDYFTVKICDQEDYIENLYWDPERQDFEGLRLNKDLVEALDSLGFHRPTKIQGKAIPKLLSGQNCLVTAETGCGKTLAYLIPVVHQMLEMTRTLSPDRPPNKPLSLILAPSRDLVKQIAEVARRLSHVLPFRVKLLVGGHMKRWMLNPQFEPVDLQVSTPGALTKLVTSGLYDLSGVRHVVMDEGDSMLDDSFNPVTTRLLNKIKIRYGPSSVTDNSQLTIVSATMPRNIYNILDNIVERESLCEVSTDRTHRVLPHVPQTFYRLSTTTKPDKLFELIDQSLNNKERVIVFSNKTKTCDWIAMTLQERGVRCSQLNGGMPEELRRHRYTQFRDGESDVLSCTDIASRGLDTVGVRHIINYEFPRFMADYVHRCGRTGRVGSHVSCRISNFISSSSDIELVQSIETAVRLMNELPNVNGNISKIIQHRWQRFNSNRQATNSSSATQ